jgi:hypothetical protein
VRVPQDDANRAICDFLHYAFLPSRAAAERKALWYRNLLKNDSIPSFSGPDIQGAQKLLETIVSEEVAKYPGSRILATITSGFDARAIFSALLNVVAPERIVCCTFGAPGNVDFDRASFFTEGLGVEHVLDRRDHAEFSTEAALDHLVCQPPGLPRPISYPSARNKGMDFKGLPMTNGFLGDPLAGSHLGARAPTCFDEAVERFVQWNRKSSFIPTSLDPAVLLPAWYDPRHALPRRKLMASALMGFEDQLDLCYRQAQYVRVMGASHFTEDERRRFTAVGKRPPATRHISPLADPRWQRSFLKLRREDRFGQRFYKEFLRTSYPHVFKDLVDPQNPRWAKRNTLTNFDWGTYWTDNPTFRSSALAMFESLRRRRIWFDPMLAAELADAEHWGAARLLRGFCSLELNIRAGVLPEPHSGAFSGWMPERPAAKAWLRFRTAMHRLSDKIAA